MTLDDPGWLNQNHMSHENRELSQTGSSRSVTEGSHRYLWVLQEIQRAHRAKRCSWPIASKKMDILALQLQESKLYQQPTWPLKEFIAQEPPDKSLGWLLSWLWPRETCCRGTSWPYLDFWPAELWHNTSELLQITKCVLFCFSSKRKINVITFM